MTNNNNLLTTNDSDDTINDKSIIPAKPGKKPKAAKPARTSRNQVIQSIDESNRPHRVPISEQKRIYVDPEDGFVVHLFNDKGDRIRRAELAGWEKMSCEALGKYKGLKNPEQLGTHATQSVGDGITAYYMKIPKDLYEKDQAKKVHKTETNVVNAASKLEGDTPKSQVYGSLNVKIGEK